MSDEQTEIIAFDARGMLPGVSKASTSIARIIDRLPDGRFILVLEKRARPNNWTVEVSQIDCVRTDEIER